MARYIAIRLALGAISIAGVILLTFILQFSVPGDPARRIAGPRASPEVLANVRADLHLNDPEPVQLLHYVENILQGDLGTSYIQNRPVSDLIIEKLPTTALLAMCALIIELVVGGGLGLWDGLRRRRSRGLAATNVVLLSIPTYSLGFIFLFVFAYRLQWLPLGGGDEREGAGPARDHARPVRRPVLHHRRVRVDANCARRLVHAHGRREGPARAR